MAKLELMQPDWNLGQSFRVVSSCRGAWHSKGRYAGLNLGSHVGDDLALVEKNRQLLADYFDGGAIHWLDQVHGSTVASPGHDTVPVADAYFVDQPGIACAVMTADCLPVVVVSRSKPEAAVIHAGWRGLSAGVIEAAVEKFDSPRQDLAAWLAPAIGPDCFEVGEDVLASMLAGSFGRCRETKVLAAFVPRERVGKYLCDLYYLARLSLAQLGIVDVCGGGFCTYSQPEKFYSYRRDGVTGRMATVAMIQPW